MSKALIPLCVLLFLPGCRETVDLAVEKAALLEHDREFEAFTASDGYIESYRRYSAEDLLLLPPGGQPRSGRERIYREDSEEGLLGHLEGFPEDGSVAASGDLGWTWGRWTFTLEDDQGENTVLHGKYLNVWKRIDGEWRLITNIWNENPEPYGRPSDPNQPLPAG